MADDWRGEALIKDVPRDPYQGAGHAFGKSGLSKRARGESDKAPPVKDDEKEQG